MKDKLRLVFLPFVLALAGLTVGYTLLNWLLFVKLGLFHPKESLTQIVFPLLLAGATSLFYIAPKLKALKLKIDFYHTFLACLGLLIPTVFAQKYRSEEHTSELQSRQYLVCRLLLEKKKKKCYISVFILVSVQ